MLNRKEKDTQLFSRIWKTWLAIFALGLLLAVFQSPAKAAQTDDERDTKAVIEGQLSAFKNNDVQRAFDYAAPSIQRAFGNANNFVAMVRQNYAVVFKPASVQFIRYEGNGEFAAHALQMIDQQKVLWNVYYELQRRPQGEWRIFSCEIEKAETDLI